MGTLLFESIEHRWILFIGSAKTPVETLTYRADSQVVARYGILTIYDPGIVKIERHRADDSGFDRFKEQRTKQIGTRRAIGARKIDIIRYFLIENWLMTTIGVVFGAAMTIGLNYVLVTFARNRANVTV